VGGATAALRFGVLGPLQVIGRDGPLPVSGPRQLALLAVLLLEGRRVLSRDRLIDELWGDDPPPTAVNALQVHVAALRRALGAGIRTVGSGYALDVEPAQVDANRFERLLDEAAPVTDHARRSALLAEALALWRGQALSDVARTPTVAAAAGRLEELRLGAIEDRVDADLAGGRHDALVPELRELVAAHPDRERLAGHLMLALHRAGRSAEALDAFRDLSATLDRRLGVDPSDALVALEKAIRRADPTLAAPLSVSLPAPASRFIGRERELAETAALLGRTRLLTLVGPGGCGKTRLAIELAARALADHPDGVHFVDLAPVAPAGPIAHAVAAALRVRDLPGEPLDAALAAHLRHRRLLVVLDNCEHVAAAAATLSRALLEAAPGLRLLATSRQPLGIAGETVWRVPSLALPAADAGPDAAAGSDAVRLLADRAAEALPGHGLGDGDALLAAAVCRRLDALPLAIELVAGRLPSLSLSEVAGHLDRRLALLASAGAAPRRRHQTMAAAIEWSHELLGPEERALFRRLAVFVGGFGLAAAEVVAPDGEEPPAAGDVLPVLVRLVDKSMVVAERVDAATTRYRLLETIRDYALARLEEAGETAAVRARHARWCRRLVEDARKTADAQQGATLARLEPELGNVRAALDWCLGAGRTPEEALAIAAPLWWFWWVRGGGEEGRAWLLRCLDAAEATPAPARALGLRGAATLARTRGDYAQALRLGEEALAAYRALDDQLGVAAALNGLCNTECHLGDYEAALPYAIASVEQARVVGSRAGEVTSLQSVAFVLRCLGRWDEAEAANLEALAGFRETGNRRNEGTALNNLALVAYRRGDLARARQLALECLAMLRAVGFVEGELDALLILAAIEIAERHEAHGLLLLTVLSRERERMGAVLNREDGEIRDAAMAGAVQALDEPARAAVRAEARRTGLDAIVGELLEGAPVSPSR
jgi:predicted ATPase/DNA-binding SARP family transcriptional activator